MSNVTLPPIAVPGQRASEEGSIPSADAVEKAFVDQGATSDQIDDALWLLDYAAAQKIASFAQLAKEIGSSESTVSRVLRGKYEAGIGSFCAQIENFRAQSKEQQDLGPVVFVPELSVVKRITQFCDLTRATKQIGIIWGKNQTGKSSALEYYAGVHPMTAYVKLPAGGATKPSMKKLALARGGISTRKSHEELREMILKRFNPLWLPIADEFHQTIKGRSIKTVTIDRFREVRDDCKCGLVICGTDQIPEMMEDERYKDFLGQVSNRGVLRMHIPTASTAKDVALLSAAYGFTGETGAEAAKLVRTIANENGISKLCGYFAIARRLANKAHERLAWKHFVTTEHTLTSWAKGEFENAA